MSAPTFKQLEKRQDRVADTDDIRDALKLLREAVKALENATLAEVRDCLDDVSTYLDTAENNLQDYVELADYEPHYRGLIEGVERLRDSVRFGLHDEPKSVPEFALALDDLLRDTDAT